LKLGVAVLLLPDWCKERLPMKQMQWVLCLLMVHVLGQALLQLCAKHKDPEGQEGRLEVPRPS